ncbi:MAG: hypothetical protein AAGI11_20500 [Pseudomonadota bacterium]
MSDNTEAESRSSLHALHTVPRWLPLIVIALALLAYGLSLEGSLVFDTKVSLTHNELVQIDGRAAEEWRAAMHSFRGSATGRPIAMLTFAMNHALSGDFVVSHLRATNLAIHLLNAALVFIFLKTLLVGAPALRWSEARAGRVALLAASIWLLHPLHVSTVFYVVQRMAQLSALFVLLGLWLYCHCRNRFSERGASAGEVLAATGWLGLILIAGVFSKENAALLVWLIPAVEVCVYRGRWAGRDNAFLKWLAVGALVAPILVVALLVSLDEFAWLGGYIHRDFTLLERGLTQVRVLWHYVGWLVLPSLQQLSLHHDDIQLSTSLLQPVTTLTALLGWLLAAGVAWVMRGRQPLLPLVLLFFLVGHAMESSILPLEMTWEHRNYLPSVALCLVFAAALDWLGTRLARGSYLVVLGVVLLVFSVTLSLRADRWSDELLLARVNLENRPDSLRSNYHYANLLYRRYVSTPGADGQMLVASRHYYERMHQLDQEDIAALVSLYFLDQVYFPKLAETADWFGELENVSTRRRFSAADFNSLDLLVTCLADGACNADSDRVISLLQLLQGRFPYAAKLWMLEGRYLESLGDEDAALDAFKEALRRGGSDLTPYLEIISIYDRRSDAGQVYLWLSRFLAADPPRRELLRVKTMLGG